MIGSLILRKHIYLKATMYHPAFKMPIVYRILLNCNLYVALLHVLFIKNIISNFKIFEK